jgi:hypothetical protein
MSVLGLFGLDRVSLIAYWGVSTTVTDWVQAQVGGDCVVPPGTHGQRHQELLEHAPQAEAAERRRRGGQAPGASAAVVVQGAVGAAPADGHQHGAPRASRGPDAAGRRQAAAAASRRGGRRRRQPGVELLRRVAVLPDLGGVRVLRPHHGEHLADAGQLVRRGGERVGLLGRVGGVLRLRGGGGVGRGPSLRVRDEAGRTGAAVGDRVVAVRGRHQLPPPCPERRPAGHGLPFLAS